jgi:rare lipoprotein A (peptidoglycan hydrolase)
VVGKPQVTAKVSAAKPRAVVAARPAVRSPERVVQPAVANNRIVRRTSTNATSTAGLIDDGTLWRENGSVTTWQQTGVASWYGGKRWQGHRMSSGARYDENLLTAAHATLPIGTKVRVALHDGQRNVIVTITDRPGTRTRIIDLSRKAAAELGILERGIAMVTLTPL